MTLHPTGWTMMSDGTLHEAGVNRPGDDGMSTSSPGGRVRRLHEVVRFAFPHRHAIAVILALTMAVAGVGAIEPLILKAVFDDLAQPRGYGPLLILIGVLLGLAVLRELLDGVGNWMTWRTRIGLQYALLEAN